MDRARYVYLVPYYSVFSWHGYNDGKQDATNTLSDNDLRNNIECSVYLLRTFVLPVCLPVGVVLKGEGGGPILQSPPLDSENKPHIS